MIEEIKKHRYFCIIKIKSEDYHIENEIVVKYKLAVGKQVDNDLWKRIVSESKFFYYDRMAKNKLKKLLTVKELEIYLLTLNASKQEIDDLIAKYLKYGYLNDENYAKSYIELRKKREGKTVIKDQLLKKGIIQEVIGKALSLYNEEEIVNQIIEKEISKDIKISKIAFKNKIISSLLRKGFNRDIVYNCIEENTKNLSVNEQELIKKEYQKLFIKYQKKKQGYELKTLIKTKLYKQGYKLDVINEVIDNESV
ncbi:MAG: RecX family transcriptional regulator [Acholeplasma sp.]|nr:RecX family transcriptional regulator [Acholeplasma sp.]